MADKVDKPKKQKAKAKPDEKGVLAALPSTRPERIGTRRSAAKPAATSAPAPKSTASTRASKAAATKPSAKPSAKRAAAKRTSAKSAAAKPAAAGRAPAKPRATAARRKAAAPRTFEPTQAAETAAGAADERVAGAVPLGETPPTPRERTYPRPRPVREGAPGIGGTGYRDEAAARESGRPSGVELATTAVRAAGEVAQLGFTLGGHVLKRVVDRIPKP
jgi:hypothetical protein